MCCCIREITSRTLLTLDFICDTFIFSNWTEVICTTRQILKPRSSDCRSIRLNIAAMRLAMDSYLLAEEACARQILNLRANVTRWIQRNKLIKPV